jgi:hypothetical protein
LPEAEVAQDAFDHGFIINQRNYPHLLLATRTQKRIGFPDLLDEFAPLLGRDVDRTRSGFGF